jgi:hypothetical protein
LGAAESISSATTGVVVNVNDAPTGSVTISGTATQNQTLTAANTLADVDGLGTIAYQWLADGSAISGATASTLTLTQEQVGKAITVQAAYTDLLGAAESISSATTGVVVNVNNYVPIITPSYISSTLTADAINPFFTGHYYNAYTPVGVIDGAALTIALDSTTFDTYLQVIRNGSVLVFNDDSNWSLNSLINYTYQVGDSIYVTSFGTGVTGAYNLNLSSTAIVNYAPTGAVTISGTAIQNETLTAANTLADVDGLGTIAYQWLADGSAISGATASTLTLTQEQVGKAITVQAAYTDLLGAAESISSATTGVVVNVNDAPTGSVTISGTATQNEILTASNGLADIDGLGTIAYQWLVNGTSIFGEIASTLTLTQEQVGKTITVQAAYTDLQGSAESVTSLATANVVNVNDAPTLTAFASTVASGNENSQIAVTFANLQAQGNDADVDGTVTAFVVKAVSAGILNIGTSAGTALAWATGTNDTVDATHQAYWAPLANTNGNMDAFTVMAKDDSGLLSATATQAKVAVYATEILGNAPLQISKANPNAWINAWSSADINISQKADVSNSAENWSSISLNGLAGNILAGGDLYTGDLGVSGQTAATSKVFQEIDGTEALRFNLNYLANEASVSLSRLFYHDDNTLGQNEAGRLQAYNANNLVGELVFSGDKANGQQLIVMDVSQGFNSLVFTAGAYDNQHNFVSGAYLNDANQFATAPYATNTIQHGSDYLIDTLLIGVKPQDSFL